MVLKESLFLSQVYTMMNKERKILIILFILSTSISISIFNIIYLRDRYNNVQDTRAQLLLQLEDLDKAPVDVNENDLSSFKELLDKEKRKFLASDEADPYKMGLSIISLMENSGVKINEYRTIKNDESFLLEFSVESASPYFFKFWESLLSADQYYSVPLLTLNNEKDGISAVFRIGYAVYE